MGIKYIKHVIKEGKLLVLNPFILKPMMLLVSNVIRNCTPFRYI